MVCLTILRQLSITSLLPLSVYKIKRYSTEHEDEEQSGSDDLRMMLDETRFSFSELSSLESFRSSTGDSIDSNSSTLTVSQQEPKADRSIILTANLKEEEEFPIQSTSKYSNFLKVGKN